MPFNDRDPEYDEWLNLDYHDFIQAGGSVGYEEQEYRVLKDATDWWKTEEYPDGPDFPQYAVHSNYAGVWSEQGKTRIAHQKILLGEGSFVELPLHEN